MKLTGFNVSPFDGEEGTALHFGGARLYTFHVAWLSCRTRTGSEVSQTANQTTFDTLIVYSVEIRIF
jgi:hypothetical protein